MKNLKFKESYPPSPIQTAPTKKKIGFFSAIMLVIGSSIGAGIFIKNHEIMDNVHGAILYAIMAWFIAIIGIIALALALTEICSGAGSSNSQGIVGWVRKFNHKFLFLGSKNFMTYLHIPIYYYVMPFYLFMTVQEAFGFSVEWYWVVLGSFGISTWFVFVSGLSARAANIQNWMILAVKFVPLAFAAVAGFVMIGIYHNDSLNWIGNSHDYDGDLPLFSDKFVALGVLSSIPAIFFAFDGFYSTAGIQTEMKEPKKVSLAMAVGIAAVSAIDIIISFSLLLGTKDGKMAGLQIPFYVIQVMEILVAIGILGVINGVAIYGSRYYEDIIRNNEMPFASRLRIYADEKKPLVGTLVSFVIMIFWFIIFTVIGLFFMNLGHYEYIAGYWGTQKILYGDAYVCNLYSFADMIANWNAVLAFVCIIFAVCGALKNRRTKLIKVEQSKSFVVGGIVSTVIVGVGLSFIVVKVFGDLIMLIGYYKGWLAYPPAYIAAHPEGNWQVTFSDVLGGIFQVASLFIFIGIMFIPAIVRIRTDTLRGVHQHAHRNY